MECVVDFVQQKIPNFSPYHLKCNPEKYLNFLFMVFSDLEAYNQELARDLEQNKYIMLKLFTLLLQKKFQPLHIKIDSTCLKVINKKHGFKVPLDGYELWDQYFDLKKLQNKATRCLKSFWSRMG
jgi:hypothetical protein